MTTHGMGLLKKEICKLPSFPESLTQHFLVRNVFYYHVSSLPQITNNQAGLVKNPESEYWAKRPSQTNARQIQNSKNLIS